jgi:hypothetical protein
MAQPATTRVPLGWYGRLSRETPLPDGLARHSRDPVIDIDLAVAGDAARRFFCEQNGYPFVASTGVVERFANAASPRLSCIVLVAFNAPFARRVTIPSIIERSAGHPIEIIVVASAGLGAKLFSPLPVVSAPPGVAEGYNLGAAAARGDHLAFFHDDCMLADGRWFDRCLTALDDGADCVTSELHRFSGRIPFAKCVPLVLSRRTWEQSGGFDEFYFLGLEDVDFSLALRRQGKAIRKLELDALHFNGMSTIAAFGPHRAERQALFALMAPPRQAIADWRETVGQRLAKHPLAMPLFARERCYLAEKYRSDLAEAQNRSLGRLADEGRRVLSAAGWDAAPPPRAELVARWRALISLDWG